MDTLTVKTGTIFYGTGSSAPSISAKPDGSLQVGDQTFLTGDGTVHYIPKFSSTEGLSNSVIVSSGSNVGIGTTTPSSILEVQGLDVKIAAASPSTAAHYLRLKHDNSEGIIDSNRGKLKLQSNDSVVYTLDNVGIGTATPTEKLTIFGGAASPATSGTGANGNLAIESSNGNSLYFGSYSASPYACWLQVSNYADQSLTYPLILQPNGNSVGIGTTNPSAKLHLQSSDSVVAYFIRPSASPTVHIGSATSAGAQIGYVHADDYAFFGHDADFNAIAVASNGNVGINTTSPTSKLQVSGAADITDNLNVSGIVGIGTSPTTHRLEVAGGSYNSNLKLKGGGASAGILFADSDNNTDGYVYAAGQNIGFLDAGADWMIRCVDDQFISFSTDGGTEHMRVNSDGDVGIGTTSPGAALDVQSANASNVAIRTTNGYKMQFLNSGNTTNSNIFNNGASGVAQLDFQIAGSTKVTIDNSGDVGIGTSSPSHKLQVLGPTLGGWNGANVNTVISSSNTYGNGHAGGIAFGGAYNSSEDQAILAAVWASRPNAGNGQYGGMVHIGGREHGTTNISTVLNVDDSNVGIGTTSPAQKLHVVGDAIKFERTDNALALQLYNNNASPADDAALGYLQFMGKDNDGTANIVHAEVRGGVQSNTDSAVNGYLSFLTTNNGTSVSEAMRIKADGSVGIGITNPTKKLHVVGDIEISGTIFQSGSVFEGGGGGGGSSTFVGLSDTPANFTSSANKFLRVNAAANAVEFADGNGLLDITSAKFTGDGSTSGFALSSTVNSASNLIVTVGGLVQTPVEDYTIVGGTGVFLDENVVSGAVVEVRKISQNSFSSDDSVADAFTGDGSTSGFALSFSPNDKAANVLVSLNGIIQQPNTAYVVNGTSLNFASGTVASGDVIDARHITIGQSGAAGGSASISYHQDIFTGNGVVSGFSMGRTVSNILETTVFVNGLAQISDVNYFVDGTGLTFTSGDIASGDLIMVRHVY